MCTAWVFWMMKITSRMRAPKPAIRVGRPRRWGAGGGRAEPMAHGGGRLLVVPWGWAVGSGMTFLFSRK